MYLAGRGAWTGRSQWPFWLVFVLVNWVWLQQAFVLNRDPHGFGPRNALLLVLIGWLPPLNSALSAALLGTYFRRRIGVNARN